MEIPKNVPELEPKISLREKYLSQADSEGYIKISAFATTELNKQTKSVAGLIDGEEGTDPDCFLGKELRYKGSSGNYSDMKFHIDDLEEFIKRVREYFDN